MKINILFFLLTFAWALKAQFIPYNYTNGADPLGWFYNTNDCTTFPDSFYYDYQLQWLDVLCDTCEVDYIVKTECCSDTSSHVWEFVGCCPQVLDIQFTVGQPTILCESPNEMYLTFPITETWLCECCETVVVSTPITNVYNPDLKEACINEAYIAIGYTRPCTSDVYQYDGVICYDPCVLTAGDTLGWEWIGITYTACGRVWRYPPVYFQYIVTQDDIDACCVPEPCPQIDITFTGGAITTNSCTDITINASGGASPYTYAWNPTGTLTEQSVNSTNNIILATNEPLNAIGNYEVTVTDANGCTGVIVEPYEACTTPADIISLGNISVGLTCIQATQTQVNHTRGCNAYEWRLVNLTNNNTKTLPFQRGCSPTPIDISLTFFAVGTTGTFFDSGLNDLVIEILDINGNVLDSMIPPNSPVNCQ